MRQALLGILGIVLSQGGWAQGTATAQPAEQAAHAANEDLRSDAASASVRLEPATADAIDGDSVSAASTKGGMPRGASQDRFGYYVTETYLNPSVFTAPAFRASLRMASPPGKGATKYPDEWRQGAEAFGRNYGDAFAVRLSTHTALFLTGELSHESPGYLPSESHRFIARSSHALFYTFVDRTGSGRRVPALSNFVGAAAGGFVGDAYLPDGFRDMTHAGQRATFQLEMLAAGNLFREFAPQMPGFVRTFFSLVAR
jgi:hypothetical protein